MFNINNKKIIILILILISLIYFPALNREWQIFDEREIFYNESIFPRPTYFNETFEIISTYAFNYNIESQNLMFSNIVNIRSNPLGTIFNIIISYLFNKNSFPFHLLSLLTHLINSVLVFFIFYRLLNSNNKINLIISALITLIWALHPANIEAVMMSTNWNSLVAYGISLALFLYNITKLNKGNFKNSASETLIIAISFFISLLIAEYPYALPAIIFFISLALIYKQAGSFYTSFKRSFILCVPYLTALFLYVIFHFAKQFNNPLPYQGFNISIERFFWLTPQIFFHFFKLFFFPIKLSIFQSNLLPLNNLTGIKTVFFILCMTVPILLIFLKRSNTYKPVLILIYSFFFSLVPFLHIITPTYCLIAERYCYFPLFIFLSIIATILPSFIKNESKNNLIIISALLLILVSFATRTVFRLKDWKDSSTLYLSSIKCHEDALYKGFAHSSLGYCFKSINNTSEALINFITSTGYLNKAINDLRLTKKTKESKTLKYYGLDKNTLITNAAFRIASIRFNELRDKPEKVLAFYEPYITSNIDSAGNSQLDLYAKLLLRTNQKEKALKILRLAENKYPYSPTIIFSLSSFYLNENDLTRAEQILKKGFYYYPNYKRTLQYLVKLYELKNDQPNLAKYEYLLGLRTHSQEAYQKSLQIYLELKKLYEAKNILSKLMWLDRTNPVTLLLLSKYYLLTNNGEKIIPTLKNAYSSGLKLYMERSLDVHVLESIILSLISFNLQYNNLDDAKIYLGELEKLPGTFKASSDYIAITKKKFNWK